MFLTETQKAESKTGPIAIYWIGDEKNPRQFGVCFEGDRFNIARQGQAESVALALDVAWDAVDKMETGSDESH